MRVNEKNVLKKEEQKIPVDNFGQDYIRRKYCNAKVSSDVSNIDEGSKYFRAARAGEKQIASWNHAECSPNVAS